MMRRITSAMLLAAVAGCGAMEPDAPVGDPLVIGPVESIEHHARASDSAGAGGAGLAGALRHPGDGRFLPP